MYVGNLESTAKAFSSKYFMPRFESPKVVELIPGGFTKEDVFEKVLRDTKSSTIFKYVSEDATRCRGPSTYENLLDEVQNIAFDEIGIINETMATLETKRERYAGTPLSTANTLHIKWKESNQCEWMTKCVCGHWNHAGESNNPILMIQEQGWSCIKCGRLVDTNKGEWVAFSPAIKDFVGFHLCQPMLAHYHTPKQWPEIYRKVKHLDEMVIHNELLGLAYDSASTKPITLEQLQGACTLGRMYSESRELAIYEAHRRSYVLHTNGTDFGVNERTSRTVSVQGALTPEGIFEVYWAKNFKHLDYHAHVREVAKTAMQVNAKCICDGGPDPARGILLTELVGGPLNCQLTRYEHGKLIQHFAEEPDWRASRWVLHRSDILGWCFRMIKCGRIRFPCWEDMSEYLQDLLNVNIEIREGLLRQEMFYRHDPKFPDDFLHAIAFAAAGAFCLAGDPALSGGSSSSIADTDDSSNQG